MIFIEFPCQNCTPANATLNPRRPKPPFNTPRLWLHDFAWHDLPPLSLPFPALLAVPGCRVPGMGAGARAGSGEPSVERRHSKCALLTSLRSEGVWGGRQEGTGDQQNHESAIGGRCSVYQRLNVADCLKHTCIFDRYVSDSESTMYRTCHFHCRYPPDSCGHPKAHSLCLDWLTGPGTAQG